jgi:aryl-alcohol dehydrogenase-like predicted oxidoreductase
VRHGKVREIGVSNETPYGVHEFVRVAEHYSVPRIASVQNPYCLVSRAVDNGLDETMHRLGVSLLAYSPLGFGLLTGKYDASGLEGPQAPQEGRLARFESMRRQRCPPLQRAGPRARAHADADGAGLVLHELARHQHDPGCHLPRPAR